MGEGEELLNEIMERHGEVAGLEDSLTKALAAACHLCPQVCKDVIS